MSHLFFYKYIFFCEVPYLNPIHHGLFWPVYPWRGEVGEGGILAPLNISGTPNATSMKLWPKNIQTFIDTLT